MATHRKFVFVTAGVALLPVLAAAAFLHTALASSSPAKDGLLVASPTELRLDFTTPVDPRLGRVVLLAADSSPLSLDSLRGGPGPETIIAPILSPMPSGTYTVAWMVIGSDGHPVRGRYAFTVDLPAELETPAPPPAGAALDPVPVGEADPITEAAGNEVNTSAYVATRWLTFATILVMIGVVTFRGLVLSTVRQRTGVAAGGALDEAASRAARLGRGAALFLLLAIPVRAMLQARALAAGDETTAMMRVMLVDTPWGHGLMLQTAAALVALFAFHTAIRGGAGAWMAGTFAALAVAITPALSGHAAAVESLTVLAIASDTVHVLAASAWLGTLLVLMVAGVPAALRNGGHAMVAHLVAAFSPLALVFAAIMVGTGTISAVLHFDALAQLWTTAYGRTLLIKLLAVALVAAVGAYNWRKVRPRLAATGSEPLRLTGGLELLGAAVILLVTAVLTGTPTP